MRKSTNIKEKIIKKPIVLFSIEVLKRDLLPRLKIAEGLTKAGLTCLFIPQYILVNCLKKNAFKNVNHLMLKSCQGFMFTEYLDKFEKGKITISSLDEELFSITDSKYISSRHDFIGISKADKIFCSNEEEYDWLQKKYSFFSKKFIMTGNPRSELSFNLPLTNKKIKPDIFFISTFPSLTRSLSQIKITEACEDPQILKDRAYKNDLFKIFNELIKSNYKNNNLEIKKIIMRPHPRDNLKKLEKLCKSNQISMEENFIDIVSHCNKYDTKIIHFGSSSCIELKGKNISSNLIYSEKLLKKYNLKIPRKIYKNSNPINIDEKNFTEVFNSLVQNKSKILNLENNISKTIADEILSSINEKINLNNSESISLSSLFNKLNLLKVNLFTLIGRNNYALTKCNKLTKDQKLLLQELFPNMSITFKGQIIVANS